VIFTHHQVLAYVRMVNNIAYDVYFNVMFTA